MSKLRFGMIGLSEGNGHPYSWSAIFNGYDPAIMARCPFPAIPAYLGRQRFPTDAIADAAVTHIWTQARRLSEHIAAAARIPHIVDEPRDMIGNVDGILLARDDAEYHYEIAAPFLDAGLPIYIDKPLALSVAEAKRIYARQGRGGQVFTCSALAYAKEFRLAPSEIKILGKLRFAWAVTVKDWDHYAIHVIEPLRTLLAAEGSIGCMAVSGDAPRHLDIVWASGLKSRVTALGVPDGEIFICLYGENESRKMVFRDTFAAFRAALNHFTDIVSGAAPPQDPTPVLELIRMVEAGRSPQ